ncbi:MAG: hypothetical protein IME94_05440 [Proteobacteria bacterium]|nr:hypothetical protein [Pseudomonadota bacterium]
MFLMVSKIFDDKSGNPIGVSYLSEGVLAFLLFFTFLFVASRLIKGAGFRKIDFLILVIVFGAWFLSAFNAFLVYKQPIIYGLIEDRRILDMLVYYPLVYAIRSEWIDHEDIIRAVLIVGLIAIMLSILFKVGLFGAPDVSIQNLPLHKRADRTSIGTQFVILSTLFAYTLAIGFYRERGRLLIIALIGFLVLVVIVQTRKIVIIVTALMLFFSLKNRFGIKVVLFSTAIAGLGMAFLFEKYLSVESLQRFIAIWSQLTSENYLTSSARAHTIASIWYELKEVYFMWGYGSLSLLWNDGFHRFYGANFFLADVGLAGMFFRYGLFMALFFIGIFLYAMHYSYQKMSNIPLRRSIGISMWFIILSPGAGLFLYLGTSCGIMLAIASGFERGQVDYFDNK